jgi:tryptophan-rich sensory protein
VLLCKAAGVIGSVFAYDGVRNWYPNFEKPSFNPLSWVFGPVWTLLYSMMGVSFYVASRQQGEYDSAVRISHTLFGIQLELNVLWTYVFFKRRSPGWVLVEIIFLWVAIAATTWAFEKVSRTAALLLLPYLLWTGFAAVLNYSIWRLNK